jgi:hypothetical protein
MLSRTTPLKSRAGLKRGGPLRRSSPLGAAAPKRREVSARAEKALPHLAEPHRFRLPTPVTDTIVAAPKRVYVRSKALREAYRLIPCQGCQAVDGTVVCAHSNWGVHGKGERIKADDNRAASLCNSCHMQLDQGSKLSEAERKKFWWAAHVKSIALMCELSLWPPGVPVPDIERCDL